MMIEGFVPFAGHHCETNTTGNLLKHAGLELSEPMLFGIGEGLSFGILNITAMGGPFTGGRTRSEEITKKLAEHLDLDVEYRTTRSKARAWDNVASFINRGQPVGVKLDMHFLDYVSMEDHFAAHYVAVHGYDEEHVFVVDTADPGTSQKTRRSTFEEARLWKGPMASPALTWTVNRIGDFDLAGAMRTAIRSTAEAHANPPVGFVGIEGIRKAARSIPTWIDKLENPKHHLDWTATLWEEGGTGGAMFRNFYRDFLLEAEKHLGDAALGRAAAAMDEAAGLWTESAGLLLAASQDGDPGHLEQVGANLEQIAQLETTAMAALTDL